MGRYDIHTTEGEYEPGSNQLVLKNLLGITAVDDISGSGADGLKPPA